MSRKHLLPPENEDYLERLGLNEEDRKVYMATLDAGLVSVGEIVQLTEFSLSEVLESVRDLVDIGLIKKAMGRMPRYYATLPFFRETMSVEKEALFSFASLINSLKESKSKLGSSKEKLLTTDFPKAIQTYLDGIYKTLISPILRDLATIKDEVENLTPEFLKSIENENTAFLKELDLILTPLKSYVELANQKFDISLIKENEELDQYIIQRKNGRVAILKEVHTEIAEKLKNIKLVSKDFGTKLTMELEKTTPLLKTIEDSKNSIQENITVLETAGKTLNEQKERAFVDLRELKQIIDTARLAPESDKSTFSQIENYIVRVEGRINDISLDSKELIKKITNAYYTLDNLQTTLTTGFKSLGGSTSDLDRKVVDTIDKTAKNLGDALNSINTKDDESLNSLKTKLKEEFGIFEESLKKEGKAVLQKVEEHSGSIDKNINNLINHWKNRMLGLFNLPVDAATPFLDKWVDMIKPLVDEFKENFDKQTIEIFQPLEKLEQESYATLIKRTQFVRAMLEARSSDLQKLWDFAKSFDYTKSSDTWVVIGIPSIFATLSDMIRRTKNSVTIVSPRLNAQLLNDIARLRTTTRITVVCDMEKETDKRLLRKVREIGRIQLRRYPDRDLYACIRDSEEIIFGFERQGEEIIGIRSSTPSMIELLQDRLNETVIRNSKPFTN